MGVFVYIKELIRVHLCRVSNWILRDVLEESNEPEKYYIRVAHIYKFDLNLKTIHSPGRYLNVRFELRH